MHVHHAGPRAALQEFRHGSIDEIMALASGFLNEFGQRFTYDVLVGSTNEFRKPTIDGADFTIQSERNQNVIKGVDEIAITLLGTGDPLKQLIELLFAGGFCIAVLDALN